MKYRFFKENAKQIKIDPIKYEDVENMDMDEFRTLFNDKMSQIIARKYDVDILNRFAKLSNRKKYKIHKWLERTE